MLDQEDEGTRIGVWVTLGVVFFVLVGVIGGLVLRQTHAAKAAVTAKAAAAKPAVAAATATAAPASTEALLEGPLAGDLVGKVYFESGTAALPADAASQVDAAVKALAAAPARTLVLSGFHDATGDAAVNAELAKQRAMAMREALKTAGIDAARVKLRKPESTTGDGSLQEARRVELRLVD